MKRFLFPAEHAREEARRRLAAHAWPPGLGAALERLGGHGVPARLVGGSVRDVVIGRPLAGPWDVATPLTPAEVRARFPRVVPIGEAHGTVLVIDGDLELEATTLRREGAYGDARHPDEVFFTHDALADLARRDFTVNALAWDPRSGELLDPHDGALDLARRRLRAVGDAEARLAEDALRALRLARFAAVLEFAPDEETRAALPGARANVARLSAERVRGELERMLAAPRPSVGFEILREGALLDVWLPELAACRGVPQNRFHAYDVYFHSLYSCDHAPREKRAVRWAALLHDLGKPATRAERDGDASFHGHADVGARLADVLLERLRVPSAERQHIVHLVREHMFDYQSEWTDAAVRRFLRRVGPDDVADLFDLRLADALGNGLRTGFPANLDAFRARIARVLTAGGALAVGDLAIGGREVMAATGWAPGPEIGRILHALLDEVIEHPERNTREVLLERVRALAAHASGGGAP